MKPDPIENHFRRVADASPVPVILYNMPANTGIDMDAGTVIRLSSHPNIIGLKDSGGNVAKIGAIYNKTRGTGFQVSYREHGATRKNAGARACMGCW